MAAKDLESDVIKRQELDDMTTCCICAEVFKDPKALPCIHTFCMKCLQDAALNTNKGAGDEMPCPICRRMFRIPTDGFHGLPKNFFIENLIQVANVSDRSGSSRATLCDACLDENNDDSGKEIPAAETFCVDCNQKFCEECCRLHKKLKLTKNHKLIGLQIDGDQNVMTDLVPSVCELHEQSVLNVYCADCKTVVCAMCFIDMHRNHEGSHVKKFADGFRKQLESNTKEIHEYRSKAETMKAEMLSVKEDIQKRVEDLECNVERRKDELKQFTDRHAASLLQNLCSIRQSKMKEIQLATDDIDTYLSSLVTYHSYCMKILARGSASDICRAFADLSFRALELKEQCQPIIEREIQSFDFCFRKSELEQFLEESCDNLIGEIEEEGYSKPKKRSKESQLLEEQSNKIDLLNKEIEIKKTENENLTLSIGQLKINIDTEIQVNKALRDELDKEKAKYDSCTEKLKKELNKNKTANNSLQVNNDKLKKELDARNMAINSLKDNINQRRQELYREKIAKISLQTDQDKIKRDLDKEKSITNSLIASKNKLVEEVKKLEEELKTMKTDSENKILYLEEKLKQEKSEKKQLMIIHSEEKRRLHDKLRYNEGPVLVERIKTKDPLEGDKLYRGLTLTLLDEELFIASEKSSEVEVYDSTKLSFIRQWNLKELINPRDIVSCNVNKCLYIMDYKGEARSKEILRVDPNGNLIKNWSSGDNWGWGLSVTNELNVILTVFDKNKLIEYSEDGKLIREINLSSDACIRKPWHAIKLSNGGFVVSHGCQAHGLHRVCVVDAGGQLKKSFGRKCGADTEEMNEPRYLTVDRNGFVMVADRGNRRVLLLDSDLNFKGVSLSREKHTLPNPTKILLDESNGRLFVSFKFGMGSWGKISYRHLGEEHCEILIFDF